jgi:hypothetical protein
MKTEDIVFQLQRLLPTQTNLFTKTENISGLSRVGSTVTATTSAAHNLTTGEYVSITEATNPVLISSLTRVDATVTAITATDHDLTQELPLYQNSVTIAGANESDYNGTFSTVIPPKIRILSLTRSGTTATAVTESDHGLVADPNFIVEISGVNEFEYNGKFEVVSTPTSKSFTYVVGGNPPVTATGGLLQCQAQHNKRVFFYGVATTPASPATGTINLLEPQFPNKGYNGRYVVTVVDSLNFTYEITATPNTPAVGNATLHSCPRVSGAVEIERAMESYTQQATNNLWAYVVLDGEVTSKNRQTLNDSTSTLVKGSDEYRLTEIRSFSVYVVIPSIDSINGDVERDLMVDVKKFLYKSLLSVKFPTDLCEGTLGSTVPTSNNFFAYAGSYYIHRFQFETTSDITLNDAVEGDYNVAFKCIDLEMRNEFRPVLFDDRYELVQ